MNAKQARAESQKNNKHKTGGDIDHLMKHVKTKISLAIKNGEFSVKSPLKGLRCIVSNAQTAAVYAALRAEGYTVSAGFDLPHLDERARKEDEVSW